MFSDFYILIVFWYRIFVIFRGCKIIPIDYRNNGRWCKSTPFAPPSIRHRIKYQCIAHASTHNITYSTTRNPRPELSSVDASGKRANDARAGRTFMPVTSAYCRIGRDRTARVVVVAKRILFSFDDDCFAPTACRSRAQLWIPQAFRSPPHVPSGTFSIAVIDATLLLLY